MTQFTIIIVTNQEAGLAEQELRKAIALAGYDISDFFVDEDEDNN